MTRGNQREIDRQRAANRHAKGAEPKGGDPIARRVRGELMIPPLQLIVNGI